MFAIAIGILKVVYLTGTILARVVMQSTVGCSKSHLRFQKTENEVPFLIARSVFINLRALILRRQKKAGINAQLFRRTIRGI